MTCGAVEIELILVAEVRNVGKPQIHVDARYDMVRNQCSLLRKSWVFDFFGRVTTAAVLSLGSRGQCRLNDPAGVTGSALGVARERRKLPLRIKLVAEGTVCAEAGLRIQPRTRVRMLRV